MNLIPIIANLRIQDVLDIIFLVVVVYHLYLWFRGTKAFKALVGLLALGIVFTVARTWGLFLTTWMFQILWQVLVILLIILFQNEIRQVLERVNPFKSIGFHRHRRDGRWIEGLSKGIFALGARKIGALIIIERLDRVSEWITGGMDIEGDPTPELLSTIFQKESPLHDGAILIRDDRLDRVACFLPLTTVEGLPQAWGTRHRAALGLTERCDALVVIVSEERGEVSLARGAEVLSIQKPEELNHAVEQALLPLKPPKKSWWGNLRTFVTHQWLAKLGTMTLVCMIWLLLAGQQDFEVSLSVPLALKGLPAGMEIVEPLNPRVSLRVRGLRKDASTLGEKNVGAEMDLSRAEDGRRTYFITRDQISLPNESIYVVGIDPPQIRFQFKKKGTPQEE